MKRVKKALIAIFVVAICALTLTACGETTLPTNKPIKWTSYLDEVGSLIEKQVQYEDNIVIEITGNSSSRGKYYSIYFGVDFDVKNVENSAMALIVKDKERTVFSLLADEGNTYLDVGQNDVLQTVRLKLTETGLFSWLGAKIDGDATNGAKIIKDVFVNIGQNIFNGVDVDKDKTKYSFMIDEVKFADGILKSIEYILQVDPELSKIFLGILGVNEKDDVASLVQGVDGNVEFSVQDGKIVSVNADCTSENNSNEKVKFSVKVGEAVSNIKDKLPTSDEGYKVTKVGTAMVSGTIGLYSQSSRAISYDYTLNVNLDLMKLIYNDYDLSTLSGDNYFHLRLTHKCSEYCKEFCLSKISRSKGAVVDVAYSPKHFGTNNLYVNVNLQAIMSENYRQEKEKYFSGMGANDLPEYVLFTFTPEVLREKSYISKFFGSMYLNYMGVKQGEFDYSVDKFKQTFSASDLITLILNDYFISEEYVIDEIKLRIIDNVSWQTDDYNIYKDAIYIIDSEISELKRYTSKDNGVSRAVNVIEYKLEDKHKYYDINTGTSYWINNIYDNEGNIITGVKDDTYIPLSEKELSDLPGKTLKMSVVDLDKETNSSPYYAQILEVISADYENFETVQEVILRVNYPNPFEFVFGFFQNVIESVRIFFNNKGEFSQLVKVNIKLTKEVQGSFKFRSVNSDTSHEIFFRQTDPDIVKGVAEISYENGYKKQLSVMAKSKYIKEHVNVVVRTYSLTTWGIVPLIFNVAGREIHRDLNVKKPNEFTFEYEENEQIINKASNLLNYIKLHGIYKYEGGKETKTRIHVTFDDLYINNNSVNGETDDWGYYQGISDNSLVFYKTNDYLAEIRKKEYISEKFTIKVKNNEEQKVEYDYEPMFNVEQVQMLNSNIYLSGNIINEKHGIPLGKPVNFEVRVKQAIIEDGEFRYYIADANNYSLKFSVKNVEAVNGKLMLELPEVITERIIAKLIINIKVTGTYRIEVLIENKIKYTASFTVL